MNIILLDDDRRVAERWADHLKAMLGSETVVSLSDIAEVHELEARRKEARDNKNLALGGHTFDQADVLIVDYDLFSLEQEEYLTGEQVAYLARCYSTCGVIVALNQYVKERGANYFDLTLRGDMESYADLNVTGEQIVNAGLWKENWTGFRPWYWPLLPKRVQDYRACKGELTGRMDTPILDYFDLDERAINREALEYLETHTRAGRITFQQFVDQSDNGLRGKDRTDPQLHPAIAASRIAKWLDQRIAAGQNLLVDAPHLVARFPSLISHDASDIDAWNRCANMDGNGMNRDVLVNDEFPRSQWLSRKVWRWGSVSKNGNVTEVARPWDTGLPPYVFCEDLSAFAPREQTREFVADVPPPYNRRTVVRSGTLLAERYHISTVEYWPQVRFAL